MMLWVAVRKELMEQWRSYRLLIVSIVLLIFAGLMSPLAARYGPEILALALPQGEEIARLIPTPTVADSAAQYLKNMSQLGVFLALLTAMGAVAQEKDKGTAALMLVKPMPRSVFLIAKFVALVVTFGFGVLIASMACYYYTLLMFEAMDVAAWLALNGLVLLFLLFYVALTLLCSTLTSSQVVAGGLAFGTWMVLSAAGALPKVGEFLPGQLITWGGELMSGGGNTWWPALGISVGLILAALTGAWAILERQEL